MILSGQSIRKRGIFTPFSERAVKRGLSYGLSACGYDVRIDLRHLPTAYWEPRSSGEPSFGMFLGPGKFMLAATFEHFDIPTDLVAFVLDKSTWARQGLTVQNTVAEPGWRGYLTLELTNHGPKSVQICHLDPIAQVQLQQLDESAENPYNGKYQDQERGPQRAR